MITQNRINQDAGQNPTTMIAAAETEYDETITRLAAQIRQNKKIKMVLLAGPSGSGKTTTAHILRDKLVCEGMSAEVVSLDHFYLSASDMPKQENGELDFETVYALDIPEIHRTFRELMETGRTVIPTFNFVTKKRDQSHPIDLLGHGICIVEGLHALNPVLTEGLERDGLFRIYISANQTIYDERGEVVLSSRQIRLVRRLSRDFIYRDSSAAETLSLWTGVVKGEEKYLYCFKNTADMQFVTFHRFEPCVFRDIILSLLSDLPETAENYEYAMRVKDALEGFVPLSPDLVPETSLIREFLKGGVYEEKK